MPKPRHIVVLGATGMAFSSVSAALTLYVRNASRLPAAHTEADPARIRVVEGGLTDQAALEAALTDPAAPVEAVVSFLGAYPTLSAFLLRTKTTPIADSFPILFAAMKKTSVKRILALSTPAWLVKEQQTGPKGAEGETVEFDKFPWSWWLAMKVPPLLIPQGHKEMEQIARRVVEEGQSGGWGLKWTVFRVPHLNAGGADERVSAGIFGHGFVGTRELSRKSMVNWVLEEVEAGEWINKAPAIGNY
ncbi:uncharacterized protein A1O9_09635 [Exophiala aquamarina CBS 119918]|uniref:NAD(P)-binding domain-containing protein n=1 Tax=Exophiala aquamarina CBS 119918 TaxID=1182545 RepID=A0A072P5A2_9EURO|nr:uncharacterized protein A1O9_09635 [Exophiala aquamarina CBS 119918]KEF54468.1 hypothetical protein A1O9_09635 [Exophiala aquamarina CBS 119918]